MKALWLNLVLSWLFALVFVSSFCMCGHLMYSRTAGAVIVLVSASAFFWVVPRVVRTVVGLVRSRNWWGVVGAGLMLALASVGDFGWFLGMGMVSGKVLGFGDEYFADGLSLPADVQVDELTPEDKSVWELSETLAPTNCAESLVVYGHGNVPMHVLAWVNPGTPGKLRLTLHEVTTGKNAGKVMRQPKDIPEIEQFADPNLKYPYFARVRVRGATGHSYAVRFELWFDPSDGQPSRLLLLRVCRVEGVEHHG